MNNFDPEILTRASQGDIDAFEQVYKAASGFVYNVALRITRNGADAEEVTQDVFMKIYRNLRSFQFRAAFKTWVYRITVNTAINHYRRTARAQKGRVEFDAVIESYPAGNSTAEGAAQGDNESMVNALLDKVSPKYRECLLLREIEGLSYQEIAAALTIPVNTVRTRLKRARQALLETAGKVQVADGV